MADQEIAKGNLYELAEDLKPFFVGMNTSIFIIITYIIILLIDKCFHMAL